MFKLIINYKSSWRNSFLSGENNNPLTKESKKYLDSLRGTPSTKKPTKREYTSSNTALNNDASKYQERKVTLDTVMGILNKLIGDCRKLYQSREDKSYYFKGLEDKVEFKDTELEVSSELVYLRNFNKSIDPGTYSGEVNIEHPLFTSDFSKELWGVLNLEPEELFEFILFGECLGGDLKHMGPFEIVSRMGELKKSTLKRGENLVKAVNFLKEALTGGKYEEDKKGNYKLWPFYCSALYLQQERLASKYDMEKSFVLIKGRYKPNTLKGFSKNNFTPKDFFVPLAKPKIIFGNPFKVDKVVGVNEITGKKIIENKRLKKVDGELEIKIDIPKEEADNLKELIMDAGVGTFYVGKKGLAWITAIRSGI